MGRPGFIFLPWLMLGLTGGGAASSPAKACRNQGLC